MRCATWTWSGREPGIRSKKRDEAAFQAAAVEIQALKEQAARGEIVLGYLDETGFAQAHPNRCAWTLRGQQHLIPALRGKRLNVLAALMSTGELNSVQFAQNMNSDLFVGFLDLIAEKYDKPVVIILDNASVHTAKKIAPYLEAIEKKGLKLYFLPPYSPELNRIEKPWYQMKYVWMNVKHRTIDVLNADISHILQNFGIIYKFNF
jgi:transposase